MVEQVATSANFTSLKQPANLELGDSQIYLLSSNSNEKIDTISDCVSFVVDGNNVNSYNHDSNQSLENNTTNDGDAAVCVSSSEAHGDHIYVNYEQSASAQPDMSIDCVDDEIDNSRLTQAVANSDCHDVPAAGVQDEHSARLRFPNELMEIPPITENDAHIRKLINDHHKSFSSLSTATDDATQQTNLEDCNNSNAALLSASASADANYHDQHKNENNRYDNEQLNQSSCISDDVQQTITSISSNAHIMNDGSVFSTSSLINKTQYNDLDLSNDAVEQLIDSNVDNASIKENNSISDIQDSLESTIPIEMTPTNIDTANQNVVNYSIQLKPFSSIPGPWPSLPFIGTGWQYFYFFGRYDLSKLHMAYIDKYRTYGPILKEEYQWGKSIVHIYDPTDFETVFRAQGRYPIRPPNEFVSSLRLSQLDKYPSIGLANLNGEEWAEQRHKLAPAIMKLRTINENVSCQNEVCDDFLQYLWKVRDPKTNIVSNLQEGTYRLALEAICVMCLDSRVGSFDDEQQQVNLSPSKQQSINDGSILIEATKMLFDSFNQLYYGLPIWKYFSTNAYSNLKLAESNIYEIASKYVDKAMNNLHENYESNHSVLQTLLNTNGLSQEEVKITIIDFISGGIFTVSNTLVYLFYHLAANQQVQQKLYDEIVSIIDDNQSDSDNCQISYAHIAKMAYLKACVRECFRLNCPVPGIMRVTSVPLTLSGYHVPANTAVFSHTMATCLIEKYFKDPHRFWPERWIDSVERSRAHPFALLPFGFGSRMCVGKRFSETEIYLAAAKLIRAYRIELVPGFEELELTHAFLVIPARPISLRIVPRC